MSGPLPSHNGVKCRHYLAAVSPCPSADHIIRVRCRNYGIRDLALRLWIQYPSKEVTGIQKNHGTMHLSIVSFIIELEFARMLFNTAPKILQSANCNAFNLLFVIITAHCLLLASNYAHTHLYPTIFQRPLWQSGIPMTSIASEPPGRKVEVINVNAKWTPKFGFS